MIAKVRLLLRVVACLALASIGVPVGLWLASGRVAWLLLVPVLLSLLLFGLLQLGLWGSHVLAAHAKSDGADCLRVYAHAGMEPDVVTVLAINLDPARDALLAFPELDGRQREVYAVKATDLLGQTVLLNGEELALSGGMLPALRGIQREEVRLEPLSYAFVVFAPGVQTGMG